jgi:hypothetical protein
MILRRHTGAKNFLSVIRVPVYGSPPSVRAKRARTLPFRLSVSTRSANRRERGNAQPFNAPVFSLAEN